jgi:hypothetical protein
MFHPETGGTGSPRYFAVDARDDAHHVVQFHFVSGRHAARHGFIPDARMPQFLLRVVGVHPEHVERYLAVNRDRLDALDDRSSRALQHTLGSLPLCRADMKKVPAALSSEGVPHASSLARGGRTPVMPRQWLLAVVGISAQQAPPGAAAVGAPGDRPVFAGLGGAAAFRPCARIRGRGTLSLAAQSLSGEFEMMAAGRTSR